KQIRAGSERCQILEEQCLVSPISQHLGWERLECAVAIEKLRGCDSTNARDARIAVRGVADEGQEIGDQFRIDAELRADGSGVEDSVPPPIDLHDALAADALRELFVGRPNADL